MHQEESTYSDKIHEIFRDSPQINLERTEQEIVLLFPETGPYVAEVIQLAMPILGVANGALGEQQFTSLIELVGNYASLYEHYLNNDVLYFRFEEFALLYKTVDESSSDKQLRVLFAQLDTQNRDQISTEDACFVTACRAANLRPSKPNPIANANSPLDFPWSAAQVHDLFEKFDSNNHNGLLSLAEIDKAMSDMWPEIAQHKPALMRAFKTADLSQDGFVNEREFAGLLLYMAYYDKLFKAFALYDTNGDHRINLQEFIAGHAVLGMNSDPEQLKQEFDTIDLNHGGQVLFDEFCHYMTNKFGRPGNSENSDLVTKHSKAQRLGSSSSKTSKKFLASPRDSTRKLNQVSEKKKGASEKPLDFPWSDAQIHELFEAFDANNHNGILSLAEIDKAMIELWPEIAKHKPALMRAYKTADVSQDGFINEKEFAELLLYMCYYDKLFEKFSLYDTNGDNRVSLEEFIAGHAILGFNESAEDLKREFKAIDLNGGGFLLFDEFCYFMTKKFGRPGTSKNTDLVTIPKQSKIAAKSSEKQLAMSPKSSQKKLAMSPKPSRKTAMSPSASKRNVVSPSASKNAVKSGKASAQPLDFPWTAPQIHELFEVFDANNHNGLLSLAEIDKAMIELWPEVAQHKQVLMRAYKTSDASNDGFITENEFSDLLLYMCYYDRLFKLFQRYDTDGDHRISLQEFTEGHALLGLDANPQTLKVEFEKIDANGGGLILFDEFCQYMTTKFGRPGMSTKTDLVTAPNATRPANAPPLKVPSSKLNPIEKAADAANAIAKAADSAGRYLRPLSRQQQDAVAEPRSQASAEEPSSERMRRSSVERKLQKEQNDRRRLERTIDALHQQLKDLGVNDSTVTQNHLHVWDGLQEKNSKLAARVQSEQQRNEQLQKSLLELSEKVRLMEHESRKDFMEESKRARSTQVINLMRDLRESRNEVAKFERLYEETTKRLAFETEKNRQQQEEIVMLRQQLGIRNSASTKTSRKQSTIA